MIVSSVGLQASFSMNRPGYTMHQTMLLGFEILASMRVSLCRGNSVRYRSSKRAKAVIERCESHVGACLHLTFTAVVLQIRLPRISDTGVHENTAWFKQVEKKDRREERRKERQKTEELKKERRKDGQTEKKRTEQTDRKTDGRKVVCW